MYFILYNSFTLGNIVIELSIDFSNKYSEKTFYFITLEVCEPLSGVEYKRKGGVISFKPPDGA